MAFAPQAALAGRGDVTYAPILAPESRGFGPYEVHPNRTKVERDGSVELVFNGEFLVAFNVDVDGEKVVYPGAFCGTPWQTARSFAEKVAARLNGDKPTRVVDEFGNETTSVHTRESVEEALRVAALDQAGRI